VQRARRANDAAHHIKPIVLGLHAGRRLDSAHRLDRRDKPALEVAPDRLITPRKAVLADQRRMELLRGTLAGPLRHHARIREAREHRIDPRLPPRQCGRAFGTPIRRIQRPLEPIPERRFV